MLTSDDLYQELYYNEYTVQAWFIYYVHNDEVTPCLANRAVEEILNLFQTTYMYEAFVCPSNNITCFLAVMHLNKIECG